MESDVEVIIVENVAGETLLWHYQREILKTDVQWNVSIEFNI